MPGPAFYAATGHLLFVRDGKIFAQAFDADRQKLEGDPFVVEEHAAGDTRLSASAAGPIVYRLGSANAGQRQLAWFDRAGRETDKVVYADTAAQGPALSHDGRRIGVSASWTATWTSGPTTLGVTDGTESRSTLATTSIRCGRLTTPA